MGDEAGEVVSNVSKELKKKRASGKDTEVRAKKETRYRMTAECKIFPHSSSKQFYTVSNYTL